VIRVHSREYFGQILLQKLSRSRVPKEMGSFLFQHQMSEPVQRRHTAQDVGSILETIQVHIGFAAVKRIRSELGRLDVLVNNAAISHTRRLPGMSVEEFAKSTRPSNVSLDELREVFETNVFGVVAVTQAMLPLLREAPAARIVNVSSGAGSLTLNSDPAFPWRSIFGPVYPASKTALNAMTLAMAIELEWTGIKVNAASPGFTKTNLNNYAGTQTVEEGAREPVRLALLGPDGPTGTFSNTDGVIPWSDSLACVIEEFVGTKLPDRNLVEARLSRTLRKASRRNKPLHRSSRAADQREPGQALGCGSLLVHVLWSFCCS